MTDPSDAVKAEIEKLLSPFSEYEKWCKEFFAAYEAEGLPPAAEQSTPPNQTRAVIHD